MATRNFWLDMHVDGRDGPLAGGPQERQGGMHGTLYIRHCGGAVPAVRIGCQVGVDGALRLFVWATPEACGRGIVEINGDHIVVTASRDDPDNPTTKAAAIARANTRGAGYFVVRNGPKSWIVTNEPRDGDDVVYTA